MGHTASDAVEVVGCPGDPIPSLEFAIQTVSSRDRRKDPVVLAFRHRSQHLKSRRMNSRYTTIILGVLCLGLGVGLWVLSTNSQKELERAIGNNNSLSNQLVMTTEDLTGKLSEQRAVNARLETNLTVRVEELSTISNRLAQTAAELNRTAAEAKAAAEAAKAEIQARESKIAELEAQKDDLSKRMTGLTNEISGLSSLIKETERKLAASEGDRASLQKELKRLLAEKAELERKFNDLAILREQVRKLKEELSITRRLEFIRKGLYGFEKKGGQVLNEGIRKTTTETNTAKVEINASVSTDGSKSVQIGTNAPAAK
jgi:predicted  nucleic acid-binding Zn-ribbon protein